MFGIGPMELVLILVVALLVLGPKRMPELARTLGRGLGEFRKASNELRQSLALDEIQNDLRDGIAGAGKPKTDRPAQAGDDLPLEKPAEKPPEAAQDSSTERAPHPGELPLGNDTEHHDDPVEPSEGAEKGASSHVTETPAADASDPSPPKPLAQPADSELGSVPVGRRATDPERDRG
jgi:TatA/E family protein of Tat protein translocase